MVIKKLCTISVGPKVIESSSSNDKTGENTEHLMPSDSSCAQTVASQLPSPIVSVPTVPVTQQQVQLLSKSTIDNMINFLSLITSSVDGNSLSSSTLTSTTNGVSRPYVRPEEIRPLPQVPQTTPSVPRPKKSSRQGSSRNLTATPELNKIAEEQRKKTIKQINRKNETRRRQ